MATYLINHPRIPGGIPAEQALAYVEQVEATTAPFRGQWLAMDAEVHVLEGAWPGSEDLLAFPRHDQGESLVHLARIPEKSCPLRTDHTISDLILVDTVGPGFTPARYAQQIRQSTPAATDTSS